jgi:hypothetical protein
MPFLAKQFRTYKDFALADLGQLYTKACLERSHRFSATTLESGVFLNDGSGHMSFRALPNLSQTAPAYGVHIGEMTGDAHPDIYLVQNFFTPQPETGRMDGGMSLLLAGHGDGQFTPVSPADTGLVVETDAKSLLAIDLDGNGLRDFVVGVNDGPVRTFERRNRVGNAGFTVRLVGKPGNREAVGARVTLVLSDGRKLMDEVRSGGGYLSQSSRAIAFGAEREFVHEIQVTWPDGSQTRHDPAGDERVVVTSR